MKPHNRRVLIIVENLPVPFDTRVWQEATTLAANGYEVSVISPKGKGFSAEYEKLNGVNVYRHDLPKEGNGPWGYAREYFSALRKEIKLAEVIYRERGFDVIHGCNPPDDIFLVARRFRKRGVRYVFDHHDICPELFEAKFGEFRNLGFLKRLLYRSQVVLERQTYKNAEFAFVTNESYRQIAIHRDQMDPNKVVILRSGPKLDRLRIQDPNPELKAGHRFMIGYVGVIGQQEGIEYLLEAASILKKQHGFEHCLWVIIGGGPHLEAMKEASRQMDLDDCVTFTGRASDADMLAYLNTADVCVNSDEFNEMNDKSTMNKILEYMALAKPIVQFDLTEGRYSAEAASLYAEPNNASDLARKIQLLLEDPALRQQMGEYGRARVVNELSWEHTSKSLLWAYQDMFNGQIQ
jgi:glycosyltransferase involved in cell wall biosynthesis